MVGTGKMRSKPRSGSSSSHDDPGGDPVTSVARYAMSWRNHRPATFYLLIFLTGVLIGDLIAAVIS
jgi:hypothetical protein